ncbi:MAG: CHAT domain-containing protein [Aetokthonos hydrillicola CCALA 1050]|nr:CHAT domain-containing protein [Aetokthonos hydrillicola CCALA 1050]
MFRNRLIQLILTFVTGFLCTVGLPSVLAKSPTAISTISTLSPDSASTNNLVQQGKILYEEGKLFDAVKVLEQAVKIFKAQRDDLKTAMTLSHISLVYQRLGLWDKASQAVIEGVKLLETQGKTRNSKDYAQVQAQILNTQGLLEMRQGKPEQALQTWEKATSAYTQARDSSGRIRNQINQAQAMQALGLNRNALAQLTQINQNLQHQPDSVLKAAGLRNLGNVLRVVGDLDQSKKVLQQSLAIAQQLGSPSDVSDALQSLGNLAQVQQDPQTALKLYQRSAATSTNPNTKLKSQLSQLNLLLENQQLSFVRDFLPQIQSQIAHLPPSHETIYAKIDFAQSLKEFKQLEPQNSPSWNEIAQLLATSVQQAKSIGDHRAEAYALGSLGGIYEQTQQWNSAQQLTQQALLKAQAINALDVAYQWQWQLGRLYKAQRNRKAAIASYTEAYNTLKSLRNDLVAINPDIQFNFRDQVEPVYRELVDLLLSPADNSQPSQQNLVQARLVIESLQLAELDNFFQTACLSSQPILLDQVLDKTNLTAAFISPIILPNRIEVMVKLPQQKDLLHYVTYIPQKQVEDILERLRQTLEKPYTAPEGKALSQVVYNWLVQPAQTDLARNKIQTIVFFLDGSLRNIPIAALHDGKQYLVEKYSIAITPALALLKPKPIKDSTLRILAGGLTEARSGYSALTNVSKELNQIKSEAPSTLLLNQDFTSSALQSKIRALPFSVVHLATHGQFSSNPDQNFILAWDKPIKVNELSNLLESREPNNPNAIELLVLSACQTAAGDKRAVLGLAGVALRANARSTLASLWNIDDESNAVLMSRFYRELAKNRVNKAEALRRAQVEILNSSNYRHPRFWASYILLGNWL